ncbi:class I adenylate-forming enzyme family protein [Fodinicola acaciae]|uniref:class I adenylate-forming enzyme family protein n=1 Tax=Fodinicola acaciae TaxID=2681555 RepID=UPI0013D5A0D2|nr:fatty acid--CoA ligase family protein [Fodinicola acaciae]
MGIRERLAQLLAQAPPDAPAIEYEETTWTWAQLQRTASSFLETARLPTGARIGVVLENRPEHVAVLAAVLASGRCLVTLNPLQPAARLADDIARGQLSMVVAGPGSGATVELDKDGEVRTVDAAPRTAQTSPGVAVEMLTSGTTGPPKRVRLRDEQLDQGLVAAGQVPRPGRLLARSAALVNSPLVHIGGLWRALACLSTGRRLILMPKFVLEPWVSAVERHRLRAAGLVPAALRTVLDADVPRERLASLQVVTSGTAPCPAELADAFFRKYGVRVLMTYGATEFAGAVAGWTLPLHEKWWDRKAGSAGRALPGIELRVVSEGVLEIRGGQTGQGDAWVRTGDLARIDGDGFLWIDGRTDDTIIRGGFKVRPETLQRVLEAHPAVREAAVAGLPDQRLGAVPVAAVEVQKGHVSPTEAELIAHCRAELVAYEVPVRVLVLDELPRTPSSKVSRVELLDMVRA